MYVDQCLFGYSDGHRLLVSSMALGDEISELTEWSDLAPGATFNGAEGYWTGVPVPKIGRYALMRTWPAPEMPRPGCVWTHVLLLDPVVLESVVDLSVLVSLFSRPNGAFAYPQYSGQLHLQPDLVGYPLPWRQGTDGILRELVTALYDTGQPSVSVRTPEQADIPLFMLWSQQWPRLRRNFRFQTAVSSYPRSTSGSRLDINLQLEFDFRVEAIPQPASVDWVEATVEDALSDAGGSLRTFLWRYGSDVRRQRGSFQPLVHIELMHRQVTGASGSQLLKLVIGGFPERNDAVMLKQDIVDGIVVPDAQLDVLWFVLEHGGAESFPMPSQQGIARLTQLWTDRPQDLLHLAEKTARSKDELGKSVFETVTESITAEHFWNLTEGYPKVRERMVRARPELLASEAVLTLDNGQLVALLELVPKGSAVVQQIVPRIFSRDDSNLVNVFLENFPRTAGELVASLDSNSMAVGSAWMRGLTQRADLLLTPSVLGRISRASLMYEFAERLGWLSDQVVGAGTKPWCAALASSVGDLHDEHRETLESFFVGLAVLGGGEGGRVLLERYFGPVHDLILRSRLPWRAINLLSPVLPDLGWIRAWDYGLRLRIAVARAFVRWGYPPETYAELLEGKRLRKMMAEAAAEVDGGQMLAQAAAKY